MNPLRTLLLVVFLGAAFAALASPASASSGQTALFQDDHLLLQRGADTRRQTLDEIKALGADAVKFNVEWASVAPGERVRPRFDATDPSAYPQQNWARYDGLINDAQARGLRVLVAISAPAPGWATKRRGDRSGVDRPSAAQLALFSQAVGRRYRDKVDWWTIWNEPNLPRFLYPQSRNGIPYAPHLYRAMVRGAVDGLRRSGNGGDRILFGELLPIGRRGSKANINVKPLLFLREFFCLTKRLRPYRGRAARRRSCSRYRRLSGVGGFAYHPYTRPSGPLTREPTRDDATVRSLGRVTRLLDQARSRRRVGGRRQSIYITEFGYQSRPPDPFQARLSRIPGFLGQAEWLAFRNRRVASWSQYTLRDDPLGSGGDRFGTWQGGLYFADGSRKTGVYNAYQLPLYVRRTSRSGVEVWGATRPGGPGSQIQIQQRRGNGAFVNLGDRRTVSNGRGYFRFRFRISSPTRRSYRFQFFRGSQVLTSRTAKAAAR
jgi:Cellulase (glycosyl hydrolase family 5)